jgi:LysR family transcriptional activator of glutamate synthase operon
VLQAYADHGFTPVVAAEIPFGDSIFALVASGAGITVVPQLVAQNVDRLNLVEIPIHDFGDTRFLSLLARSERLGHRLYQDLMN